MMKHGILYRTLLGAVGFFAVSAFTILENVSYSQAFSARQIYAYANSNNTNALYQLRYYLETQDANGNTALCMAVIDDNLQAYNLLKQYGANTQPHCLSAALAGGSAGAASSSTFLGMGSTGWIVTGAIVAGGAGIAAAAGGGGGGGGGGGSEPTCAHGTMSGDICVCDTGWTGSNCNTAVDCGTGFKETCSASEYTDGTTCRSGNKNLKKCIAHSSMPKCEKFSAVSDTCVECKSGWIGNTCATKYNCGSDYKTYCTSNEYTDGTTCQSGDNLLKKCIAHSLMPNCDEFSPTSDTCTACKEGWTGSTCNTAVSCGSDYKTSCAADEYTNGSICKSGNDILKKCIKHSEMPNCIVFSSYSDTCLTCKEGWTGSTCAVAAGCGEEYKVNCEANEYTDGSTCKSGGIDLKKCIAHSEMPNCSVFSSTSDTCLTCKEGWTGSTCAEAYDCGSDYKASCAANEYTDGNICKSGETDMKKCIVHSNMPNCDVFSPTSDTCTTCKEGWTGEKCNTATECGAEYKVSCAVNEYTDGNICKSGGTELKKCIVHSEMPNCDEMSTTSDTCVTCKEGWTGNTCADKYNCGSGYKVSCAANEYTDGNICKSGGDDLKKCIPHTEMPNCDVFSPTSDTCTTCKEGWTGEKCNTAAECGSEYKINCADNEYTDGNICKSGETDMKKCIVHSDIPNCNVYSSTSDTCDVCDEGWVGETCEIVNTCGSDYRISCNADEYTNGETCQSGGKELKKCIKHSEMPNCDEFSPTSDICLTCKEGWTGTNCNTAVQCGDEYKSSCKADEYTDGNICKSGNDNLKKCIAHSEMPNCDELSTTSDTCVTCKEGWTGSTCAEAYDCGSDYKASCAANEYTDGNICKSGGADMKKCIVHSDMPNCDVFSPTSDTCTTCKEGWTGSTCTTSSECGAEYKVTCADNEYTDGNICKSGGTDLKKCIVHSEMPNCDEMSTTSDTCVTCKEGWTGNTCAEAVNCGSEYKVSCADNEYTDGNICKSGGADMKKCIIHTEVPNCATYSPTSDICVTCKEGWTGSTCNTVAECGSDYKASCADNEYTDGNICKSGEDYLKKCIVHSEMPNCDVFSTTSDTCATCKTGWTGDTCEISSECGPEYKVTCADNEYTDGNTCKSGGMDLIKCIVHSEMPNCDVFSPISDTCSTCKKGWTGSTCAEEYDCGSDYKVSCADNEYTDGNICKSGETDMKKCIIHTEIPNCDVYSPTSDICTTCKEGWTGEKCNTAAECGSEYKINCAANEYTDGNTCKSGDDDLKKCIIHSEMPNCDVFSPTSDTCTTCKEGWTGEKCNTATECGSEYKVSCAANEYTDGNICKSGGDDLIKCIPHTEMPNCDVFSTTSDTCVTCKTGWSGSTCNIASECDASFKVACADNEYTNGEICKSGGDDLKKCIVHSDIPNCDIYSATSDTCSICFEGWSGDQCNIASDCGPEYKTECATNEYTDGSTCKSGGDDLVKCIPHTEVPNCNTYSTTSDICLVCEEGWTGQHCENAAGCGQEFKTECAQNEYTDGAICSSGGSDLIRCIAHSEIPNCDEYSPTSDNCELCKDGWTGSSCEDTVNCGWDYKTSCADNEYTDGKTCKSGDDDLIRCIAHNEMPNCEELSTTSDTCVTCKEGWTGSTCAEEAACGSEFKTSCGFDEYTDNTPCKSGDMEYIKCIPHTEMPNCLLPSYNSDTCDFCKIGWSGDKCEISDECGQEFKITCEDDEYTDGETCTSGGTDLKKCIPHTEMPNCDTYSPTSDTCTNCKEGWTGSTCAEAYDCGSGYKVTCDDDEYTNGITCNSGGSTLKQCIPHTEMPNCDELSTTSDTCLSCKEGWTGGFCNEEIYCGDTYKVSCSNSEYTDGETCKSGNADLKNCILHSDIQNCEVYSDTSDTCTECSEGWSGEHCETATTCGQEFKLVCAADEYTDGSTCQAGGDILKKCIEHTPMPNCNELSTLADICLSCNDGWTGEKCNTAAECGEEYKPSCAANEYTDGNICKSGGDDLKKCIAHSNMPNCDVYSPTSDTCTTCKEGWTGDTCVNAVDCGSDYKVSCAANEFTNGQTCKSGNDNLKKCLAHSEMPNCDELSTTSDVCVTCKEGWEGDYCDAPDENHIIGEDGNLYVKLDCVHGEQLNAVCVCDTGYRGDLCDEVNELINDTSITIEDSAGSAYGIQAHVDEEDVYWKITNDTTGTITITGTHGAEAVGMDGPRDIDASQELTNKGAISISDSDHDAYGVRGYLGTITNSSTADISIENTSGNAYGMYSEKADTTLLNEGSISITDTQGDAYGMDGNVSDVTNAEGGEIVISNITGKASGITSMNTASNEGQITISGGSSDTYGMEGPNNNAVLSNGENGIITISNGTGAATAIMSYGDAVNEGILNISNMEEGGIGINAVKVTTKTGSEINITDSGSSNVGTSYGITASGDVTNAGAINVSGSKGHSTYGIYECSESDVENTETGVINITNSLDSDDGTYAIYSYQNGNITNAGEITLSGNRGTEAISGNGVITNTETGTINIENSRTSIAIVSRGVEKEATNAGTINFTGNKSGVYGMDAYGGSIITNAESGKINVLGNEADAYGMYGYFGLDSDHKTYVNNAGAININNAKNAYGLYALDENVEATNTGTVSLSGNAEDAYGMYAHPGAKITNAEGGEIVIDNNGDTAYGMYGEDGEDSSHKTIINNAGEITITNTTSAYGIYAAGANVIVTNTGDIHINGDSCTGNACKDNDKFIKLNGATFNQSGILQSDNVIKLDDFDGTVMATTTSKFIADDISGDLTMNSDVVTSGFDTTYTVSGMIEANNTDGLNLKSGSALFDVALENNTDAVMTMKSFNDVVENQSVADFLKQNYTSNNNEDLYNILKSKKTVAALNDTIDDLTGTDMFNRFAFEDLTIMRELNMDMNNTLFANDKKHLEVAGNITPWNFDGNSGSHARYALYSNKSGSKSFGLGVAFSDVRSNDGKSNKNSRYDQTFQVSAPFGYGTGGFKFITSPRFGYAYGTYDREGYENRDYDGKVEKRMFGLMNEVRYPVSFGKWNVAPSAEFNMLGYNVKGHENAQKYSLNIKSQNNYSVEAGLGLYVNRNMQPTKNSLLKLNVGVAMYHEFADPYELELQMNGMDGTFKVRDERRKDNRAVLRSGFDYKLGEDITVSGAIATYLDGTTHNNANLDFKYNF